MVCLMNWKTIIVDLVFVFKIQYSCFAIKKGDKKGDTFLKIPLYY